MVLRHSGRVGSRRFTELLRNNQVPEEFFCYVRPAESLGHDGGFFRLIIYAIRHEDKQENDGSKSFFLFMGISERCS